MNRAPSFQFYPRDWLDFKVQRMSLAAQGAYLKILCYMWNDSKDQCSIADNDELIARGLGVSGDTWARLRIEIQNDSDPIFVAENGCLVSRRLKAEAAKQRKYRRQQALKGTLSGQRRSNHGSTTVQPEHQPDANSSSSSSSSSSSAISRKKQRAASPPPDIPPVEAFQLAQRLKDAILERDPKARSRQIQDLTGWARYIALLIRVDGRGVDEISAVIEWCQRDDFWASNILSGRALREQFDRLFAQMKRRRSGEPVEERTARALAEAQEDMQREHR